MGRFSLDESNLPKCVKNGCVVSNRDFHDLIMGDLFHLERDLYMIRFSPENHFDAVDQADFYDTISPLMVYSQDGVQAVLPDKENNMFSMIFYGGFFDIKQPRYRVTIVAGEYIVEERIFCDNPPLVVNGLEVVLTQELYEYAVIKKVIKEKKVLFLI